MFKSIRFLLFLAILIGSRSPVTAAMVDDPDQRDAAAQGSEATAVQDAATGQDADGADTGVKQEDAPATFELSEDVNDAFKPLFEAISKAGVSRATVELTAESTMKGEVVDEQKSTYQVASKGDDRFTIYLKEPDAQSRVYCDGEKMSVALARNAYLSLPEPMTSQQAVTDLPVPLGPYPEPVLALTMAGVDPAITFVGGMKSIEIVDRDPVGETPAVHLHGVQSDNVVWDFWISDQEQVRPLRLIVDLTPMLQASDQVQVPEGYAYRLRFDFASWRLTGEVDENLFLYQPTEDAKQYASIQEYYQSLAGVISGHPLLGKPMPEFEAATLLGENIGTDDLQGKVVVLDFWATWCVPCVASLPTMKKVADRYADKDVVLYAVNTGETADKVKEFLEAKELELNVILDPEGKLASLCAADAIPQTLVIGKDGSVESVHVGFVGPEALEKNLSEELDVLSIGGRIATSSQATEDDSPSQDNAGQGTGDDGSADRNDGSDE